MFSASVHKTIEVLKLMCVFAIAITLVYLSFQMHKSNQLQKLYLEEVLLKKRTNIPKRSRKWSHLTT